MVTDGFNKSCLFSDIFMSSALAGQKLAVWPEESHFNLSRLEFPHSDNEEFGLENLLSIKVPANSKIPYLWKYFKKSSTTAIPTPNHCWRAVLVPLHRSLCLSFCRWLWRRHVFKTCKVQATLTPNSQASPSDIKRQECPIPQTQP